MSVKHFLQSELGQFVVGGTTVAGISYLAKHFSTLVAAIFGGVPIGLPSSVFIEDNKVLSYLKNSTVMAFILFLATLTAFLLKKYKKYDKYKTVSLAMLTWVALGFLYYLYKTY